MPSIAMTATSAPSMWIRMAARAHSERPFDVIYSHYLEPYGVAGHLAAQMTGAPHVVRMAGSDAGRLWRHLQFEPLYNHVLRSAEVVIAVGTIAERAVGRGVAAERIAAGGAFTVPEELFVPKGPKLDLPTLRKEISQDPAFAGLLWGEFAADRPYFGVYGKLGERKGSFALLDAMQHLKNAGLDVGLVALAHGEPSAEKRFRARASELGLVSRILQIPFLPHWRVPEFLRGCLAVCCLEQDFPIAVHAPIVPREVLMSGTCLVGSTEVIRKLPSYWQLPNGYGCVAIEDVNDIDVLSERLSAIVKDPETVAAVGARGREFAQELQQDMSFPQALERILQRATARQPAPSLRRRLAEDASTDVDKRRFPLTHLAAAEIAGRRSEGATPVLRPPTTDLIWACQVLETIERDMEAGEEGLQPLALAVRTEIAVAAAEHEADKTSTTERSDPLFRLRLRRWAVKKGTVEKLVPVRDPQLRLIEFDYDVSDFLGAQSVAAFPAAVTMRPSYIVAFACSDGERRVPMLIDETTARILHLSDGTRTISEIASELSRAIETPPTNDNIRWIEKLFLLGLVLLRDTS